MGEELVEDEVFEKLIQKYDIDFDKKINLEEFVMIFKDIINNEIEI